MTIITIVLFCVYGAVVLVLVGAFGWAFGKDPSGKLKSVAVKSAITAGATTLVLVFLATVVFSGLSQMVAPFVCHPGTSLHAYSETKSSEDSDSFSVTSVGVCLRKDGSTTPPALDHELVMAILFLVPLLGGSCLFWLTRMKRKHRPTALFGRLRVLGLSVAVLGLLGTGLIAATAKYNPKPVFQLTAQKLQGTAIRIKGKAPVNKTSTCRVDIRPSKGRYNCRIRVTCDDTLLVGEGSSGLANCRKTPGEDGTLRLHARTPTRSPEDHNPNVELDLGARTLSIATGFEKGAWSFVIKLAKP